MKLFKPAADTPLSVDARTSKCVEIRCRSALHRCDMARHKTLTAAGSRKMRPSRPAVASSPVSRCTASAATGPACSCTHGSRSAPSNPPPRSCRQLRSGCVQLGRMSFVQGQADWWPNSGDGPGQQQRDRSVTTRPATVVAAIMTLRDPALLLLLRALQCRELRPAWKNYSADGSEIPECPGDRRRASAAPPASDGTPRRSRRR